MTEILYRIRFTTIAVDIHRQIDDDDDDDDVRQNYGDDVRLNIIILSLY